jgi:tetratricopeptide (TPR) repeat protein
MVKDPRYRENVSFARLFSLEASIQLSLNRTLMNNNPPALTLLSLLSLLPDGASCEDLEALVPSSGLSREHARPETILLQLTLAYIVPVVAPPIASDNCPLDASGHLIRRVHVLAPIREYVQYKYKPEELDYKRLRMHYLVMATSQEANTLRPHSFNEVNTLLRRLGPEIHNLEAVIIRALSIQSEQQLAARSATVLGDFLKIGGPPLPALAQRLREVLPRFGNTELAAEVQHVLGRMALYQFDNREAKGRLEEAHVLYREIGDMVGESQCIRELADIALEELSLDRAEQMLTDALLLCDRLGDSWGKAECKRKLGETALELFKYAEAKASLEEALLLYKELDGWFPKADCIHKLGEIALEQSRHDQAKKLLEEATLLYEELGDKSGKARCIDKLGEIALDLSKYDEGGWRRDR